MINILITAIISLISAVGVYNYAPLSVLEKFDFHKPSYGTTLTTILGSDTLSASRTILNNNFTALNDGKIEVGTTSVNSITSLLNLSTVGTIGVGVWNGTAIPVGYGGTGTTSPTSNQLILGDSSSGFKVIGFGGSGQFLTSGGNGVAPSWTTGGIDQSLDYNFTGSAFRVKNLIASSTIYLSDGGSAVYNIAKTASTTTFNVSGTYTKSTGVKKVLVQLWGAGGSGSKSNPGGNAVGGGGGGQYSEMWFDASALSSTESITVGTGGTAVSATNTNGNNGGSSSFGSLITVNGGRGGITNSPANDGTGGDGGTPDYGTGNFLTVNGLWGAGGVEATGNNGIYSAGGGGATLTSTGYGGGNSIYGGAGGGGAGSTAGAGGESVYGGVGGAASTSGNATAGTAPGGGGGGTVSASNSGAGGDGRVIVTEFF